MNSAHQHTHDHHSSSHPPGPGHDFASANQAFFDQHAHQADKRHGAEEMAQSIRNAMLEAYPFTQEATRVLDFACGTGIVSHGLVGRVQELVGVDISQGMVDQFNKSAAEHGIAPEQMRALRVELKGKEQELDGKKFDVVVCSLAFHHIQDIVGTTRLLSFFLKPGGTLLIIDFPIMDISKFPDEAAAAAMIAHTHGVSEATMRDAYGQGGLGGFEWKLFKGPKGGMHPEDVFLAKGVKL
ncbi:Methyltransf-25 domain-containing protein [Mycena chlorophos]|uniref:Methyltransf-25 domain-containing protein n=1 Tax=Mycena chlorophos TaxID=658473 RepID=A0A8H6TSS2_MYCCL|nr:Methyltransf-25 domain-containing protein [Mycena chlorophos]